MKRTMFQRVLCLVLSVTVLLGMFGISASAASGKDVDVQAPLRDMDKFLNASSYAAYYAKYHPTDDDGKPVANNPYLPSIPSGTDFDGSIDVTQFQTGSSAEIVWVNDEEFSEACYAAYMESAASKAHWDATFGDYKTVGASSVYLPASGKTTWAFDVQYAGLYYIKIEFYDCNTEDSTIIPFTEASFITLGKNWRYDNTTVYTMAEYETYYETTYGKALTALEDGISYELIDKQENGAWIRHYVYDEGGVKMVEVTEIGQDINGNSMSPDAVQSAKWNTYYCNDSTGYTAGYFEFYFSASSAAEPHTITLEAEREPVIIKSIELVPVGDSSVEIKSYEQVMNEYKTQGYKPGEGTIRLEAEFPSFVSDASVSATNDNSSSATEPKSPKAQLYNVIGENSYSSVGQWAAYTFTVSEDGLYKLGMRYLQNALQGMFVCRAVKLSGGYYENGVYHGYGLPDGTPTLPFAEADDARFNYSDDWQSSYVGFYEGTGADETFQPFEFYFKAGVEYTLYLECSLGSLQELLNAAETSLENLNAAYLRILQLTGADPDEYRNYKFPEVMPDVLVTLLDEADRLCAIAEEFERLCGDDTGSHIAILYNIARLLDRIGSDDGYEIGRNLGNLKSNLGTLGTWINDSKRSSMVVDSIYVVPTDASEDVLPRAKAGFFSSIWFEICSFFCSFFTDYEAMGLTKVPEEGAPIIDVWLATGRDQSKIWRSMIDIDGSDGFTGNTGVAVTLKLVTAGTLLPSILSGKGPDVYLGLGAADVINYAIRDAVLGVSGNDPNLDVEDRDGNNKNEVFTSYYYTYYNEQSGTYEVTETPDSSRTPTFVSRPYNEVATAYDPATGKGNFVQAALDTLSLENKAYGIPMTMSFAMMFYRADVLAELGEAVPETWQDLLALLPVLQANNMSVGVTYASAINFLLYQMGGNMWHYTDDPTGKLTGAKIALDTNVASSAFDFVCKLYTDYSFPVTFDAANRFRTGEMPILVGDYATIYNQLIVFATEINGLWEFCSLPGWDDYGKSDLNYDSIAGVGATVILNGGDSQSAEDLRNAWQFVQWQVSADRQADYGNKMVALIGPSAKYETANIQAIRNLSWSVTEQEGIMDQINHMSSVVNYPGSYIIDRYTKFAFLDAYNDGTKPVDALRQYINAINMEIERKRLEFGMDIVESEQ